MNAPLVNHRRSDTEAPIRAVLFDLDGTLVDSLPDIAGAMNHALDSLGHPRHALDRYPEWVGNGITELSRQALPPNHDAHIPDLVQAFRRYYAEHLVDGTRPYPGIPELLEALDARGVALAVLSNKVHPLTCGIVSALFGDTRFREVFGERPGIPRKPDPTMALEISRLLGVPPHQCAFVGDTAVDMHTARTAGMAAVGVTWGFRRVDELRESGAQWLVERAGQLLETFWPKG